jgi:hypothetical protein
MSDFVLQVLEFGVLGLCALTLILVWRVLQAEQKRDGDPRPAMIRASYMFMSFAVALAILNGYVQLREGKLPADTVAQIETLESQLRESEDKLLQIRSAAGPLLNTRANLLERLPEGPERDTLRDLVNAVRAALE